MSTVIFLVYSALAKELLRNYIRSSISKRQPSLFNRPYLLSKHHPTLIFLESDTYSAIYVWFSTCSVICFGIEIRVSDWSTTETPVAPHPYWWPQARPAGMPLTDRANIWMTYFVYHICMLCAGRTLICSVMSGERVPHIKERPRVSRHILEEHITCK